MARTTLFACLLAATLVTAGPAFADDADMPFIGTWDCEVATFTFTADTYDKGSETLPIEEVQEGSDGSWTLMFAEDYIITLSGFTGDEMGWFSPASGDSFQCKAVR